MAKREVVESDLSGAPDATTVTFALRGQPWEIDLTESEQMELEAALKKFMDSGRKAQDRPSKGHSASPVPLTHSAEERDAIRAWANENGFNVALRGRIANNIIEAYRKAHAAGEVD